MPIDVGGYRISSGMEDYFTPPTVPIITDGLSIFLDAGNTDSYLGTGTAWNDLSGNGNNFTWFTTPTFSSSGATSNFTTSGNRCTGPASNSVGINNTSGYTVFLVFKQNALVATSAFKFYNTNGKNASSTSRGIFTHCTWSDNNIYFDQGGCCNADTRTSVASGGVTNWSVVVFRRLTNSSTRSIWKNGSALTTNSNSAANIDLGTATIDLGSTDEIGNSGTWNANLNSFVVYNRGLSDSELQEVSDYFKTRFGI